MQRYKISLIDMTRESINGSLIIPGSYSRIQNVLSIIEREIPQPGFNMVIVYRLIKCGALRRWKPFQILFCMSDIASLFIEVSYN